MSKIFFVTGKSCTGKDTIFSILKDNSRLNLKTVVGYTTRPMRVGEQDGVEYFFVDEDKLNKLKDELKDILNDNDVNDSEETDLEETVYKVNGSYIERVFSDDEIDMISHENFLRVMKDNE